jgi:hypothetical protein
MNARLRVIAPAFALMAGLSLAACSGAKTPTSTPTTVPAAPTTVAASTFNPPATTAPSGQTSDSALDQQIQGVSNSLNQVNGDLANADKAAANGG